MLAEESLEIHKALWAEPPLSSVKHGANEYPIEHVDEVGKLFNRVVIGELMIITQNMRKPSVNTDWVMQQPGRELTWVIHVKNSYVGKVMAYIDPTNNSKTYEVFKLNQEDELILQVTD